jgi:hypothetical protein
MKMKLITQSSKDIQEQNLKRLDAVSMQPVKFWL